MSGTLKCERCGAEAHEDRISIVDGRLFCEVCFGQYQKEKAARPKMGKVCVIDDDRFMKSYCEKFLEDFEITQIYRLPEDESILAEFDVLVVDGQGIGNNKYKEGKDFLLSYKLHGSNRGCVYYSGLCDKFDREELAQHGIAAVTKGSDPQNLVDAVKGFFK